MGVDRDGLQPGQARGFLDLLTACPKRMRCLFHLRERCGSRRGLICLAIWDSAFFLWVCPLLSPREVNGILISGFLAPDLKGAIIRLRSLSIWNPWGIDRYRRLASALDREKFLDEIFRALNRRAEAMFKYYAQESWDLFVAHFMDTDRLHHFLWGDVERGDVSYTAWFNRFTRG